MTGKIKLTQEQASFIERGFKLGMDKEEMLNWFADAKSIEDGLAPDLLGLCVMDMARALLIGYEVEPKYKEGDWVHVSWSNGGASVHKVLKIGVRSIGGDLNGIAIDAEGNPKPPLRIVRHATAEEIAHEKEQRLWKSIGREVGEFKADEIGYLRNGAPIRGRTRMTEAYEHGDLIGFYPIESFIDFGGDE